MSATKPRKKAVTGVRKKQRSENRPYPRFPLAKAIQVIMCIKEKNGGNPWDQEDIASAIQVSKKSSNFAHIISAAREFGLIEKANKNDKIGLSELGKSLAYAPDEQEEKRLKQKAFLNIEIFGNVLNHYKGSDLPEMKYLGNVLKKDFGLSESHHEEFSRLFRENSNYVGITVGGSYEGGTLPQLNTIGANPTVVVLSQGKALGGDRLKAFVILPFRERDPIRAAGFFKEVLNSLIVPAGDKAGFSVTTANRLGSDIIQSTIVRELEAADMVIADLGSGPIKGIPI
jgi:hypothetical protein